ncbi:proline dehydrogenase family protein [bacterium]|nr:proline dehydrogenase family protein [bacterium]
MKLINFILVKILSHLPKWIVKPFASPYVAGVSIDNAIKTVKSLNEKGFVATVDILGEHVHSKEESFKIRDEYCQLYDRISNEKLDANISLKPTHLGMEIDPSLAENNLRGILEKAKEKNNFMRIDMENSPYTDSTIDIYKKCIISYDKVGMVLQSYLKRTNQDIINLDSVKFNCRICKGIYRESEEIAYHNKEKIRDRFLEDVKTILNGKGYVAIATHDVPIIDKIENWIIKNEIPLDRFEFQVLYGVPMGNRLQKLLDKGYKVRNYVPFGEAWFDYSIRRLKENPNIMWYVLGNMFRK